MTFFVDVVADNGDGTCDAAVIAEEEAVVVVSALALEVVGETGWLLGASLLFSSSLFNPIRISKRPDLARLMHQYKQAKILKLNAIN
jgi:hypothetical protein